eukprot:g2998.t1
MMIKSLVCFISLILCVYSYKISNTSHKRPPLGWSSWMTCTETDCVHDHCTESEVKSIVLALQSSGLQKLGYNWVILDDCWADYRNPSTKKLVWDVERFPSGIPNLISWLHERNFYFGLYTSAGNEGYYDIDAKMFADEWFVDYVKLDWCGDVHKEPLKLRKQHIEWATAVENTERGFFMEVVAGYFGLLGNINQYANAWRFCEDHADEWSKTNEQILCRDILVQKANGKPGGWPFMDLLMTGGRGCTMQNGTVVPHCPGQTDDEYRLSFTLWSLLQSPLLIATDLRVLTPAMKDILTNEKLLALHQNIDVPPGHRLSHWYCSEPLSCTIWGRQINDSQWLVALVNTGKMAHKITLSMKLLGFDEKTQVVLQNVWQVDHNVSATATFTTAVNSHSVMAYIVEKR